MKIGVRKPNIKKSVKAQTTGKIKRQAKKAVNPLYGKKGMGIVNDPKKAVYNKVYTKTTIGIKDITTNPHTSNSSGEDYSDIELAFAEKIEENVYSYSPRTYRICSFFLKFIGILFSLIIGIPCLFIGMIPISIVMFIITFVCFHFAKGMKGIANEIEGQSTKN